MKLFVLFLLFVLTCHCDVIGVDLGTEFVKVVAPRDATLDIVLNEQSRRKSFNFVGFRADERFMGEDARNLAPRFPSNMFSMTPLLLGVKPNSTHQRIFESMHLGYSTAVNEQRNSLNFSCPSNPSVAYSAEEISAMFLSYCKEIAAKDANIKPTDVVIAVPSLWNSNQRRALLDAAKLVDLNVLSFLHTTTASALQYGMLRRGFGNDTYTLVVYDMGSSQTEVGVYRFGPTPVKEGEKLKLAVSFGTLQTLHIETDQTVGGRTFDVCIAKMIDAKAREALKIKSVFEGDNSLASRKSLFSLVRAANRAKETLSANTQTPVTVEGIAPDKDFTTELRRDAFEEFCNDLFVKAISVAERAVKKANISFDEIDSFEAIGGGMRIPRIVNDLSTLVGRTVNRTINGDESCALGAGYYAMRKSGQFVVRSFAVEDRLPEVFSFSVTDSNGKTQNRVLFDNAVLGSRKSITLNRTDDFAVEIYDNLGAPVQKMTIRGVRTALSDLGFFNPEIPHPNTSHTVRLEVNLTYAGTVELIEAVARVRLASMKKATETKEAQVQMKTKSQILKFDTSYDGVQPLSQTEIEASRSTLATLQKIERLRRATATSKNNLETFMQHIRFNVLDSETQVENPEALQKLLAETTEWYEDGEGSMDSCPKSDFDQKLSALQEAVTAATRNKKETTKSEKLEEDKKDQKKKKSTKKKSKK